MGETVKPPIKMTQSNRPSSVWRPMFFATIVIGGIAASLFFPMRDYAESFVSHVHAAGNWGIAIVIVTYVIACIALLPGSIITLVSSFALGFWRGLIAVSVGSVLGATASFLIGRTIARPWVETQAKQLPRFQAIDQAVNEGGFKVVMLLRLSPLIPFNLLNYLLGLTRISLGRYIVASWLGMLPGTVLYVYIGSALKNVTDIASGTTTTSTGHRILFWIGLAATAIVTLYMGHLARSRVIVQQESHAERT